MIATEIERWTREKVEQLQFYIFPGGYSAYETRGDCTFDIEAAWQAVNFGPRFLQHVKGAKGGEPLELEEWQAAILAVLFGYKRPDGRRRYRMAYVEIPRGNGKSTMCAVIVGVLLYVDDEPGADIFSAAGTRDQAHEVFDPFKMNVLRNPDLDSISRCYQNAVTRLDSETGLAIGSYKAVSADAKFQHGGSPHGVIFDELHVQPNRDLWDVLQTGKVKRRQPLTVAITTAGFDRHSICWEQHQYAERVRDGMQSSPPFEDREFLPIIYAASPEDDWTDPDTWRKANPNLGVSISEEDLAKEVAKAKEIPAYENTVKRLHLDLWTEQDVRAIRMDKWDDCGGKVDAVKWRKEMLAELAGQSCVAALDIGGSGDLTALALIFGTKEPLTVLPFFWVPKDSATMRERRDRVPYSQWFKHFVTPTEGVAMDYDQVRADINTLGDAFGITELAVDRLFQGDQLMMQLAQDGFNVVAFGQGFMSMAAPTKRFLELVVRDGLRHGNNPVLRWMASNAATEQDSAGNLKFSKKKSLERIDGIVATVMGLARAMAGDEHQWFYERNPVEIG